MRGIAKFCFLMIVMNSFIGCALSLANKVGKVEGIVLDMSYQNGKYWLFTSDGIYKVYNEDKKWCLKKTYENDILEVKLSNSENKALVFDGKEYRVFDFSLTPPLWKIVKIPLVPLAVGVDDEGEIVAADDRSIWISTGNEMFKKEKFVPLDVRKIASRVYLLASSDGLYVLDLKQGLGWRTFNRRVSKIFVYDGEYYFLSHDSLYHFKFGEDIEINKLLSVKVKDFCGKMYGGLVLILEAGVYILKEDGSLQLMVEGSFDHGRVVLSNGKYKLLLERNGYLEEYEWFDDPKEQKAYEMYTLAREKYKKGDYKEALKLAQEVVKLADKEEYVFFLGKMYVLNSQPLKAIFLLKKLKGIEAQRLLAQAYVALKRWDEAFKVFSHLHQEGSLTAEEMFDWAKSTYNLGRKEVAFKILKGILDMGARLKSDYWRFTAKVAFELGDYKWLLEFLKKWYTVNPYDYYIPFMKAKVYWLTGGSFQTVKTYLEQALQMCAWRDVDIITWFGYVKVALGESIEKGEFLKSDVLRLYIKLSHGEVFKNMEYKRFEQPGFGEFLYGFFLENKWKFNEAIEFYRFSQRAGMRGPEVMYRIAESYRKAEAFEEALVIYKEIMNKWPDYPKMLDLQKKIKTIEGSVVGTNEKRKKEKTQEQTDDIEKLLDKIEVE